MTARDRFEPVRSSNHPATAASHREIPYDHVATFRLEGRRGRRVQDVVNVSLEGTFVAVAVGYGFVPARLPIVPPSGDDVSASGGVLGLLGPYAGDPHVAQCLARRICGIDFRYSIVDSGSGRELQNLAVHNLAGLGDASGRRPFRLFGQPMMFRPRSTIRIEIEEISEGRLYGYDDNNGQRVGSELSIVLHGYKILGHGASLAS